MDRKQTLTEVFQDTQRFYSQTPRLASAIEESMNKTKLYPPDAYPSLPEKRTAPCTVAVTKSKSFEAALRQHAQYPNQKITVLNFASATNPGGGVLHGSSAQEESLCRCSTLYPTLDQPWLRNEYYQDNRQRKDPRHTDACIYSPGVMIIKTDDSIPRRMPEKDWIKVDVISCAAPNLHPPFGETRPAIQLTEEEQYLLHLSRAKHILHIAAAHHTDTLILGAFGCGAFQNNPWAVSKAYRCALNDYQQYFVHVEFAVFCRSYEDENYTAFFSTFQSEPAVEKE